MQSKDTGLWLLKHIWLSFLKRGITLAIFNLSGKTPSVKDKLRMYDKGSAMCWRAQRSGFWLASMCMPRLLTWINFNLNKNKYLHPLQKWGVQFFIHSQISTVQPHIHITYTGKCLRSGLVIPNCETKRMQSGTYVVIAIKAYLVIPINNSTWSIQMANHTNVSLNRVSAIAARSRRVWITGDASAISPIHMYTSLSGLSPIHHYLLWQSRSAHVISVAINGIACLVTKCITLL